MSAFIISLPKNSGRNPIIARGQEYLSQLQSKSLVDDLFHCIQERECIGVALENPSPMKKACLAFTRVGSTPGFG